MRLSINLDNDLYAVAKSLARADDISLSSAVNLLIRRSLEVDVRRAASADDGTGLPVVRGRRVVTSEDVYRLELEDGEGAGKQEGGG